MACSQHSQQSLALCLGPGLRKALRLPNRASSRVSADNDGTCLQGSWGGCDYSWWHSGVPSVTVDKALAGFQESPGHNERSSHVRAGSWGVSCLSYATSSWFPGGHRASVTARCVCVIAALFPPGPAQLPNPPSATCFGVTDAGPSEAGLWALKPFLPGQEPPSPLQAPSSSVSVAAAGFERCFPSWPLPSKVGDEPGTLRPELLCGKPSAASHFATEHLHKFRPAEELPSPPGEAAAGGTQGGGVVRWLDTLSWNQAGLGPHPSNAFPSREPLGKSASQILCFPSVKLGTHGAYPSRLVIDCENCVVFALSPGSSLCHNNKYFLKKGHEIRPKPPLKCQEQRAFKMGHLLNQDTWLSLPLGSGTWEGGRNRTEEM